MAREGFMTLCPFKYCVNAFDLLTSLLRLCITVLFPLQFTTMSIGAASRSAGLKVQVSGVRFNDFWRII